MCPTCPIVAAEIQAVLDALNSNTAEAEVPDQLSDDRRRRLAWAIMHPILDWVYRHHVVVSFVMVVVVLASVFCALQFFRHERETIDMTLPVNIQGSPPSPALDGEAGSGN